jgi:hypothetical protein
VKGKGEKTAGRPKAKIDWLLVDKYLQADCKGVEVAAAIGVAPITLYRNCKRENKVNFEAYLQEKKAHGNTMLRVKQFQLALAGDKTMLIWLGKQRLNQTDRQAIDHAGSIGIGPSYADMRKAEAAVDKENA